MKRISLFLALALGLVVMCGLWPRHAAAFSRGTPVARTGAPGDRGTCLATGCHSGREHLDSEAILLTTGDGLGYTPGGPAIRMTLEIRDDNLLNGFQLTARLASDETRQAGAFRAVSGTVEVRCDNGSVKPAAGSCPSSQAVEFVQHNEVTGLTQFVFDWTPPATDAGDVRLYAAAISTTRGNPSARQHRRVYTIRPLSRLGPRPSITSGSVGDAFTGQPGTNSNSWLSIYGTGLSTVNKVWDADIFGRNLPLQMGGVRVSLNGRLVPIFFVSPGQVNVLGDSIAPSGQDQVTVFNENGGSQTVTVTRPATLPAFFNATRAGDTRLYAVAVAPDGTYVGRSGTDRRVTRGARSGEILLLFGTGFGPTTPIVVPSLTPTAPAALNRPVTLRLDGRTLAQDGPGYLVSPGLYQFNVRLPNDLPIGDLALQAVTAEGQTSSPNVYLSVER